MDGSVAQGVSMRRRVPVRSLILAAGLTLAAAGLGGCGFTPLYAQPGVTPGLSAISIAQPQGRLGFLLREQLDDAFAHDPNVQPQWRMELVLRESRSSRGVRVDNVADRFEYRVDANYSLHDITTGRRVTGGSARVAVTYANPNQPYAAISGDQEGQERAAAEAARQIQLQLATWIAGKRRVGD
jgi:LPS-assembly lipoprotein